MTIDQIKNQIPDFAKDIRLNLSSVLTEDGAPDLSKKQIHAIALATAFATQNQTLIAAMLADTGETLTTTEIDAVKSAAAIMAMNNIYYRFIHLVSNKSFAGLPAKLRMNIIANPGMDKVDFELSCLAISALNGCGMCMDAHTNQLQKAKVTDLAIQSAVRIAAVINATALSITMN